MAGTVRVDDRSTDLETEAVGAFEAAYVDHRSMVVRFAVSRGATDPETVADKALLDTYQAIPRLRSNAPAVIEAYLIRAATSHMANEASAEIREREWTALTTGSSPGFEDQVVDRMELHRLLDDLTDSQRAVIELRFFEDLTSEEIGQRIGRSASTVRQLQHRGLMRLRRMLFSGALVIGAAVLASILLTRPAADTEPADSPTEDSIPAPAPAPADGAGPEDGLAPTPTTVGSSVSVDLDPRSSTPTDPMVGVTTTDAGPDPTAPPSPTAGLEADAGPDGEGPPAPIGETDPTMASSTRPAAYEPFDLDLIDGDPLGAGAGASSFGFGAEAWSIRLGQGDVRFDASGLGYVDGSGNRLATIDGALHVTAATNPLSLTRPLPPEAFGDGEYWVAFLVRIESGGIGDAFWSPDAVWDRGGFGIQQSPELRFVNGPHSSVEIEVGVTHLLVGRVRVDGTTLWIDPDLVDPGPSQLTEERAPSEPRGLAAFGFNAVGDGTYTIDEFRIGDSFAAVAPTR